MSHNFRSIDWALVAASIRGARGEPACLFRHTASLVEFRVPDDDFHIRIVDNAGEINVMRVRIEHLGSMPLAGSFTTGYRIARLLAGEPINWGLDVDAETTAREERGA